MLYVINCWLKKKKRYKAERIGKRADSYSTLILMLKKKRKNCSRNIWFSYLLSSFRKRMRFLDQNWLYLVLKEEVGDLIMGKTIQC